jgi:Fur family iron response transcriptional regulator
MLDSSPDFRANIETGGAAGAAIGPARPWGRPSRTKPAWALLEQCGLRATRQRLGLAKLLFGADHRHVTADGLAVEANLAKTPATLATIYNVLNLFSDVGLLRRLSIDSSKTIFDTNTSDHGHFYFEETGEVQDIPLASQEAARALCAEIDPPDGFDVVRVDVVVRLRRKASAPGAVESPHHVEPNGK